MNRLLVVGASLAGLKAVEAARAASFEGEIVLVGAEDHLPYDRPPLSKDFLGDAPSTPYFRDPEHYNSGLSAVLMLGQPAIELRADRHEVVVGSEVVHFDELIIATGAVPRNIPAYRGIRGVHTLRSVSDALAMRDALDSAEALTILGAGFIGAEIASAAVKRGGAVTIIEASESPLERALGKEMGRELSGMHARNGVDLRCGVTVQHVDTDSANRLTGILLSDGRRVRSDLLLVSIGARPATDWLQGSSVELNPDGGVPADEFLETTVPGIYAAGDIVEWPNAAMGRRMRLEHWTSANEQGTLVGHNAVVPRAQRRPYTTIPYFWSDWYGNRVQFVGKPGATPPVIASGSVADDKFVALYRENDRLLGALAVNEPGKIMKDRRRIAQGVSWDEALAAYGTPAATVP